jgi:hypothetical protein
VLNDDRIAKLTFAKDETGDRLMTQALDAWKEEPKLDLAVPAPMPVEVATPSPPAKPEKVSPPVVKYIDDPREDATPTHKTAIATPPPSPASFPEGGRRAAAPAAAGRRRDQSPQAEDRPDAA